MVVQGVPFLINDDPRVSAEHHLVQVAKQITRDWNRYQGFIVILPPNSYIVDAATISYLLGDIGKPVVYTTMTRHSSFPQQPGDTEDMVLKSHILSSVQVATSDIGSSALVLGSDVLHPFHTRAQQMPNGVRCIPIDRVTLGHVDFGVRLSSYALHRRKKKPRGPYMLSEQVVTVIVEEDQELDTDSFATAKAQAVVVHAPEQRSIRRAAERLSMRFPVLLLTPQYVALYEQGKRIVLISSQAAAIGKLRWVIGTQSKALKKESLASLMRAHLPIEQLGVRT